MDKRLEHLVDQLQRGRIDRRTFAVRAFALGIAGSAVFSALSRAGLVSAQGEKATDIGNPDIPHITTTDKGTIKLYSSWPFTGVMEAIGSDAVEATKLALSDYGNAAGGFALEYVSLDDGIAANNGGWDAGAESANANKALADPDAMVYLGTYNSGAAKISIPIMNEAGMAQISFANTYPGLTKAIEGATEEGEPDVYYPSGKRNYMRTVPADDVQGVAGANWAYESKGARKAYVLDDQSLYGHGVAQVFNNAFRELGGEVLGAEGWDKNAPDYQALMTKIADMGPDIVYLGATVENNTPKVVLDLRSLMPVDQVTCLLPDGLITTAFLDGAGDAAQGSFVTFAGFPPAELKGPGADYATRMTEILGHSPDSYAVYAYEVVAVVIQAIDQVQEKDRGKILDAMMATKDFRSLLGGTWSFTDEGDTDALTMSLNEIKPNDEGKLDFAFVEAIGS
ncbi:MAG TPA: branched-chain amino acid ABC transporter substrate-binding protein [Thermomicrobiales bacterium]|nr:branched-chain amino acid ABC transporter substrate-binding protein [Thermomicrobiales bacterium]